MSGWGVPEKRRANYSELPRLHSIFSYRVLMANLHLLYSEMDADTVDLLSGSIIERGVAQGVGQYELFSQFVEDLELGGF